MHYQSLCPRNKKITEMNLIWAHLVLEPALQSMF